MKSILIIIGIVILAAILRFYQLGNNPPSLDWDEASLAYNAYSFLTTGHDEYGNTFPTLSIRSFNDYKPPMYVYALMPSLFLFGKTDFAVRFPSALAGTLTVLMTYFLVRELFSTDEKSRAFNLAALSAFLLAVSPWHLQFSRIAFEANLGLFFLVAGAYCLIKSFKVFLFLPLAAMSFGLAIFSYHSLRLIVPLLVFAILIPRYRWYLPWLRQHLKTTLATAVITLAFTFMLLKVISQGAGQARLQEVSFMTIPNLLATSQHRVTIDHNSLLSRVINHRYLVYGQQTAIGFFDHLSPTFWFIAGDGNPRHHAVGFGLLYLVELPFLFYGLIKFIHRHKSVATLIFPWFLLAPLASSFTSGTPNAVRSLFFLPTLQIFTAVGLISIYQAIKFKKLFVLGLFLIFNFSLLTYFELYYRHTPVESSQGWQYGYKQTVAQVMALKTNYRHILITTEYDQPYIFFLWYGNYNPQTWVNDGEFAKRFDNFEFRSINGDNDRLLPNTLLVGTAKEIKPSNRVLWTVDFLDGSPAFVIAPT